MIYKIYLLLKNMEKIIDIDIDRIIDKLTSVRN